MGGIAACWPAIPPILACWRGLDAPALGGVQGRQAGERDGGEQEAEIAEGHVVEARDEEQVDDDATQPCSDQVRAVARLKRDDKASDDFDHADEVHELVGGAWKDVVQARSEVDVPIHQDVEELVQPEENWGGGEGRAQYPERLVCSIVLEVFD